MTRSPVTGLQVMIAAVILIGIYCGVEEVYRRQHCIQLFGHWIALDRGPTVFCDGVEGKR